jgi:hypothetical protein
MLAFSSIVKMEMTCSSEISDEFQETTEPCIPEVGTLHSGRLFVLVDFQPISYFIDKF